MITSGVGLNPFSGGSLRQRIFLWAFAYLLLSVVFGWELLLPGRSLYQWDTLLYNWPVLVEARAQWLSGRLPFWAPSFCCGTPLLENINAGLFYPLRAMCWLLPVKMGYHLFLFLHLWLGFVGMHLLARRGFRVGRWAAFASALAYGASGYARGMWDTHNFMALPWVPLGFALLLEARRSRSVLGPVLGVAVAWGMMIVGGDIQAAVLWMPAAVALAVAVPERKRLLVTLAGAAILSVLVTAPQWLPAWAASAQSYRATGLGLAEATERSFHPIRLLELLCPNAFGGRGVWLELDGSESTGRRLLPWMSSFHVGLLPLLGAALAFRRRRKPAVAWLYSVLFVSLLLSFGRYLPGFDRWLRLPVVGGFRYPEKYLLWSTLALAGLAGYGVSVLQALWRSERSRVRAWSILAAWAMIVLAGGRAANAVVVRVFDSPADLAAWSAAQNAAAGVVLALVLGTALWRRAVRRGAVLGALLVVDVLLPWFAELHTTARFDPLAPPAVAQAIRRSDSPYGRFLRDRAVKEYPLPSYFPGLSPAERRAVLYREGLAFNSPCLWGGRTADGFSPLEAAAMRSLRLEEAAPANDRPTPAADFVRFCRSAAVEWVMTTGERADEFSSLGLAFETVEAWGMHREVVLLRLKDVDDAVVRSAAAPERNEDEPHVRGVWRGGPGFIRVDLAEGRSAELVVRETFAPGWQAMDQWGTLLNTRAADRAFLGVELPANTSQVRLEYRPRTWGLAVAVGGAGLAVLLVLVVGACRQRGPAWAGSPAAAAMVGCLLFAGMGCLARDYWGCTFDEGFHLARGMARLKSGDSRLSYFHPPLQNLAGAYFADLAFGCRAILPDTAAWQEADALRYAGDFASANRAVFTGMVRASRWSGTLFGLLLCAVGVVWAHRAGGPVAGWLAAFGLGLNPLILAHGNLNTSDMGVAALAVAGSYGLWLFARGGRWPAALGAAVCFALAAAVKFSGLIWLAAFVAACVPLLAAARRDGRVLGFAPLAVLMLMLLLVGLYGAAPQAIRFRPGSWPDGQALVAGRYVEGLFRQGGHALSGQKAFFAGERFVASRWWHMPAAIALKTPTVWLLCAVVGCFALAARRRRWAAWVPWIPAACFAVLLCAANRLAIGVRHALPLVALGLVGAAVWVSGRRVAARSVLSALLVLEAVFSATWSFPHYISFVPRWAGDVDGGYRWFADSNYDWGQDIDRLEQDWAALTAAGGGRAPDLVYFGFVDPRVTHNLWVGPHSWCGYMHRSAVAAQGEEALQTWHEGLQRHEGTLVASVSSLRLVPEEAGLSDLEGKDFVGRIGNSFFVYRLPAGAAP